ncbi:26S proteasome non-ATPase regulatory subunit 9 [Caligus rogercresseyi]|uniref:26S proteasome non-ATPase regulatory subunit 9 n=1 Tax=Caligus rogercresseyi TaxID=217165 RepID=C1BPE9_CALRO|nr:26S proteasome non-ATPase regulatory subunit 9 [Caligus rogercresseyi]QQP48792.1 26S proteasome non-ATPase regulatory subunit 9 [Caligus rogercresseyi]|eukprot:TRINITY_DN13272_c0_g1_i1.p1 TRINITY_DN13272_c0_g1~~TRINITY_DN13272_c0_g1_i1.p1  ORF type:complete len:203 (-),score=58.35 TRINITY_DN13272_c0_g1_i1:75-683(-)
MADESSLRAKVKTWMSTKESLESEMKAFSDILKSQGVGMGEPLVDEDDFPRNDIGDIHQIRNARGKIRSLNNDIKALSEKIHGGIEEIHRLARDTQSTDSNPTPSSPNVAPSPFARVSEVAKGSPADSAGLMDGDLILELGSLDAKKFKELSQIGDIVKNSIGSSVHLKVLREGSAVKKLELTPKQWSGKGLLGCLVKGLNR